MEFRERMKGLLLQLPDAKLASGGNEVTLRCRYCGDSERNHSERHMYVKLPDYQTPMLYNCYRARCKAKGIVTYDKLIDWGVKLTDEDVREILMYNKKVLNMDNNIIFRDREIYTLNNTFIDSTKNYQNKIDYINNRIGSNFNHMQLKQLKISLDILDTIRENNLGLNTELWKLQKVSENFIGFITQDNVYAVCRNINFNENIKAPMNFRYYKYKIHDILNTNRKSFYIIPTSVNINEKVNIFLSEGTFDILSVWYNIIQNKVPNSIFCAVLGSGYEAAIKYLISNLKIINAEIHLYLDNDMNIGVLSNLFMKLEPFHYNVFIHRNVYEGEKDFGVPKKRIIDYQEQIMKGW